MDKVINPPGVKGTPFFSIIIPTKDRERQLLRCLDSVLNQSCSNYEILLVNDGEAFALHHINTTDEKLVLLHSGNMGVSAARNAGLKKSTGLYLIFLDDDEYLESDHLETLYQFYTLGVHENTICKTGTILIRENGSRDKEGNFKSDRHLLPQVWKYGASMSDYCFPSALKEIIEFETNYPVIEDFVFLNKALCLFPSTFIASFGVIIEDHGKRISYLKFRNPGINYFKELSAIEGAIEFQRTHSKTSPVPLVMCLKKIISCTYAYFKYAVKNKEMMNALKILFRGFLSFIKVLIKRSSSFQS